MVTSFTVKFFYVERKENGLEVRMDVGEMSRKTLCFDDRV